MKEIVRITAGPEETAALGAGWSSELRSGAVLALYGDLGAGKTVLVAGIAEGLQVRGPVRSPTFTLVNEYAGDPPLYHVDLYRIGDAAEALDLGLDEYLFGEGVTVIEWAERIEELLPPAAWRVRISALDSRHRRKICVLRPLGGEADDAG